jgi:hypothetical protein
MVPHRCRQLPKRQKRKGRAFLQLVWGKKISFFGFIAPIPEIIFSLDPFTGVDHVRS